MLEDVYILGSSQFNPYEMFKSKMRGKEVELLNITISDIMFNKESGSFVDSERSTDWNDMERLKVLYGKKIHKYYVKVRIEVKDLQKEKYQTIFQYYHNEPVLENLSKMLKEKKLREKKDYELNISSLVVKINSNFVKNETLKLPSSSFENFWILNRSRAKIIYPEVIRAKSIILTSALSSLDQKLKLFAEHIKLNFLEINQIPQIDFIKLRSLILVQDTNFGNKLLGFISQIPTSFEVEQLSSQLKITKLI